MKNRVLTGKLFFELDTNFVDKEFGNNNMNLLNKFNVGLWQELWYQLRSELNDEIRKEINDEIELNFY